MPEEKFEERTEPATPRKRQEARERGHVCRSVDLSGAAILLTTLVVLNLLLAALREQLLVALDIRQ